METTISWLVLSALLLLTLCWTMIIVRAVRSHARTPAIGPVVSKSSYGNQPNAASDREKGMPKISIIVPARNEEAHIRKCLESILSQSYPNFEVIAIDDSSTDNTLAIMQELQSQVKIGDRLKVISVVKKPAGWTGKSWASEQGYLNSTGSLILFTDADSYFGSPNAVNIAVEAMLSENLDVLSGVPFLPLADFWSRIVMPIWNVFSETFGNGIADVNDKNSDVAFVMGSFFFTKRSVFESIGTYRSFRGELQEDRAIGYVLKKNRFRIKMFKIDGLVTALWSRDLTTLWHGIRRTVTPIFQADPSRSISCLAILLAMAVVPFIMPLLSVAVSQPLAGYIIALNFAICAMIIITVAVKISRKYRLSPAYAIFCSIGATFLVVCYAYSIALCAFPRNAAPVHWRGREYQVIRGDKTVAA